jgi:hypothetical protein
MSFPLSRPNPGAVISARDPIRLILWVLVILLVIGLAASLFMPLGNYRVARSVPDDCETAAAPARRSGVSESLWLGRQLCGAPLQSGKLGRLGRLVSLAAPVIFRRPKTG